MSRLDDELRFALRRVEPAPDFAGRVLAGAKPPRKSTPWWPVAIAAALMVAAGLDYEHERRLRVEGELAKARVMLALHITGSKLQHVKEKIDAIDSTRH
jgi:hypothetical protein